MVDVLDVHEPLDSPTELPFMCFVFVSSFIVFMSVLSCLSVLSLSHLLYSLFSLQQDRSTFKVALRARVVLHKIAKKSRGISAS